MNGTIQSWARWMTCVAVAAAMIGWPSALSEQGQSLLKPSPVQSSRLEPGDQPPSSQPCYVVDANEGRIAPVDNGVRAIVVGTTWKVTAGSVVTVGCDDGLVRGYAADNPFPPVPLQALGDGDYLLTGSAGSHWTVEIMRQVEGRWRTDLIEVVLGDDLVPVEPDEPVNGSPPGDEAFHSALSDWMAKRKEPMRDSETALTLVGVWRQTVDKLAGATDLHLIRKAIQAARQQVMNERASFDTDWHPFLLGLSDLFDQHPPVSVEKFLDRIQFVCDVMERSAAAASLQNDTKAIRVIAVGRPQGTEPAPVRVGPVQAVPQHEVMSVPCPGGVCPMPSSYPPRPVYQRRFFR